MQGAKLKSVIMALSPDLKLLNIGGTLRRVMAGMVRRLLRSSAAFALAIILLSVRHRTTG